MKHLKYFLAACTMLLLSVPLMPERGLAQSTFPSLNKLRESNVALEMVGFEFVSGLRDNNGKPDGNGFDVVTTSWGGSGFIVSDDGSVITNYHVARRALYGAATFDNGGSYEIKHIRVYNPSEDLAILKISGNKRFEKVKLGDSEKVQPLDQVLAVGNPMGRGINITQGQVSQVMREDNGKDDTIVHTATITSGNSGGALYKGLYVVGINASVELNYGSPSGFYNAIPINKAISLLKEYGERQIRLSDAFPTDPEFILQKFEQISAGTYTVPAAQGRQEPGITYFDTVFSQLQDYMITLSCPERDLAIIICDEVGMIGFGDMREAGVEGVIISNDYPKNIRISVVNYDAQPANFGIQIGKIAW